MIAVIRTQDNRVMNLREGSDWRKGIANPATKETNIERLDRLLAELQSLPKTEKTQIARKQEAIDTIMNHWQAWQLKRCTVASHRYGLTPGDYRCEGVPVEEEQTFMTSRYVEYDGETFTYDLRPLYLVSGSTITCTSGWVKGNEQLLADDVTDFSGATLTEPLYFQLWYCQNEGTSEISVQILIRNEDEEFGTIPANLTKVGPAPVCTGRVNLDNSITLGVL